MRVSLVAAGFDKAALCRNIVIRRRPVGSMQPMKKLLATVIAAFIFGIGSLPEIG